MFLWTLCVLAFCNACLASIVPMSDESSIRDPEIRCTFDNDCDDSKMHCFKGLCSCKRFYNWDLKEDRCRLDLDGLKSWINGLEENRKSEEAVDKSTVIDALSESEVVTLMYNKTCSHDDNCHDFRLECDDNLCVCSRFYKWNPNIKECVLQLHELHDFLRNLKRERDYRQEIDAEASNLFFHLGLSGILATALGFIGAICCVFLFCVMRTFDRKELKELKKSADASKPMPSPKPKNKVPETTKEGDAGLAQIAVVLQQV